MSDFGGSDGTMHRMSWPRSPWLIGRTHHRSDVHFTDVTAQAGIHFAHNAGKAGKKYLPETMGSGVRRSSMPMATAGPTSC